MRALALLAAITMMHTIQAIPRRDLAVRQENNLSNESHIFHHLDRNQKTANRDREQGNAEGSGLSIVKRVSAKPQRAEMVRKREMERRFVRGPDYSESDSGSEEDDPSSTSTTSETTPTQQPTAKAEKWPTD